MLHREGDKPNHLLAWIINRESPRQTITHLIDARGTDKYSQMEILKCLKEHLSRVYNSPRPPGEEIVKEYLASLRLPRLDEDARQEPDAELTVEELQMAVGLLPPGKAPGGMDSRRSLSVCAPLSCSNSCCRSLRRPGNVALCLHP